jgi:hypothetical protein
MSYVIEIPNFEMPHSKHEQHLCFLQTWVMLRKTWRSTRSWSGMPNLCVRAAVA